jgi:quercetin dioxygenase-like cupin family protein
MPEAEIERTEDGLVPRTDGWFVLNAHDVPWTHTDRLGSACFFESEEQRFPELGFNVNVMPPGHFGSMYHAEPSQEGFLVLAGQGVVVVEGVERKLRAWDYFHCPADTPHVLVATGDEPLIYVAAGSRAKRGVVYLVDETAQTHGAAVSEETTEGREAYAGFQLSVGSYREGDLPGYESRSAR